MLFHSLAFIAVFLPITLGGLFLCERFSKKTLIFGWLILASLFFYSYWYPPHIFLLVGSVLVNYVIGRLMENKKVFRLQLIILGVSLNIVLLGYFKYSEFIVLSFNSLLGMEKSAIQIALPLAISFFTFQQIAYLMDIFQGKTREHSFLQYCLFVMFFPQLIAGPIVHHSEMMPQFQWLKKVVTKKNITIGITIFVIGLFKKVVIADSVALYSDPIFAAAADGIPITFVEAWASSLAYTFQIYFDFSGYTDMAIGLARMFGITLPENFNAPYKAKNISDFWRRWHITLSRFLRDYLYIPLGGSKKGITRTAINVLITMFLGGLWHGAGWTFVLWGLLHGFFLVIFNVWRHIFSGREKHGMILTHASRILTFTAVVFAWVLFRAENIGSAIHIWKGMIGLNGVSIPSAISRAPNYVTTALQSVGVTFDLHTRLIINGNDWVREGEIFILLSCIVVWLLPTTQSYMSRIKPVLTSEEYEEKWYQWRPIRLHAVLSGLLTVFALGFLTLHKEHVFLYFQF